MTKDDNAGLAAQAPSQATPRTRRKARHILDNFYIGPARSRDVLEIWGYTDRISYEAGDTVRLHVSTTASSWDLEVGRDGANYTPVLKETGLKGEHHDTPADCSVTGCGWPVVHVFTIPDDWKSGAYLVTFTAHEGHETVEEHHLFIVRQNKQEKPASIVLVCATPTWVSYNCWGGSNAYEGISGPNADRYSPVLSLQRPWTRGFCKLPEGAPRALPDAPPKPGNMVRYPYMEWAYAYGYSKKYASAGWATYERHFARWAETNGYDLAYLALHDLHDNPDLLNGHACAVFVGHDEYWSADMRDAVDRWVDNGGRVARFAGNFLWQIRMENEGQTQVCYKYFAREDDPVARSDDKHLLTGAWEAPEINRPGALTFGVNALRGIYAGLGNCVGRGAGGFTIYRPEHWAFDGAEVGYGDVLGSQSRIFGYEVDGLDHVIENGLPRALGTDGASPDITILGLGLGSNLEADHHIWGETLYIGDGDARWKAETMLGDTSPEATDKVSRGNGMMISWPKGKGEVFTAATCEWVMGLTRRDIQVERVTRNVLDRFTAT